MMKKLMALTLSLIMICTLAACAGGDKSSEVSKAESKVGGEELANPFVECSSLEMACEVAGFSMTAPDAIEAEYALNAIRAVEGTMIEVEYIKGTETFTLRKGTGEDDISGVYNEYSEEDVITLDEMKIEIKGENDLVSVATWQQEGYSFSAYLSEAGVDRDTLVLTISQVK